MIGATGKEEVKGKQTEDHRGNDEGVLKGWQTEESEADDGMRGVRRDVQTEWHGGVDKAAEVGM